MCVIWNHHLGDWFIPVKLILSIFSSLCWNWNTGEEYYRNFPTVMGFSHLFHFKTAINSIKLYKKYNVKSIFTVQTALAHWYSPAVIHSLAISWSQYMWNKHSVMDQSVVLIYYWHIDKSSSTYYLLADSSKTSRTWNSVLEQRLLIRFTHTLKI